MEIYFNIAALNSQIQELRKSDTELEVYKKKVDIEQSLQDIYESIISQNDISLNLNNKISKSLSLLDDIISNKFKTEEIDELTKKIIKIQSLVISKTTPEDFRIPLKMGIFLDLDSPDYNGAFFENIRYALKENLPFITTFSMLQGRMCTSPQIKILGVERIKNEIILNPSNWNIYQYNGFILFMPKTIFSEMNEKERLEALDFDCRFVNKITLEEAFKTQGEGAEIECLFDCFREEPEINKAFFLGGHGNESLIGSLNQENYNHFLAYIQKQKCKVLIVDSCQAGGKSSLFNIPDVDSGKFSEKPEKNNLSAIIVYSSGDFDTFEEGISRSTGKLLDEVAATLEHKQMSRAKLKRHFDEVDQSLTKSPENLAKAYLYPSATIPGGFYPINEKGATSSITFADSHRVLLHSKKPFNSNSTEISLVIRNKENLCVHPLVVNCIVRFEGQDPMLFSMVPGHAHHFFKEITLFSAPEDFLKKTAALSRLMEVNKAFFIETLKAGPDTYSQVIICSMQNFNCWGYKNNGKYSITFNGVKREVSSLEYSNFFDDTIHFSIGSEKAIKATTGGQQSEQMFKQAIEESLFFKSRSNTYKFIISLIEEGIKDFNQNKNNKAPFLMLEKTISNLDERDRELCVILLFKKKFCVLGLSLLKQLAINPNARDIYGTPLIFIALRANFDPLLEYILTQNVDINVSDPLFDNNSFLHSLINDDQNKLIEKVLKNYEKIIDLDKRNTNGKTPLALALDLGNRDIFKLLLSKHANVNDLFKDGKTLLGELIEIVTCYGVDHNDGIDLLLEEHADPNLGKPSAVTLAVLGKNRELVNRLIKAGANLFENDSGGGNPFIEAILTGNQELIKIFLEHPDCKFTITDGEEMTPLIAALLTNNQEVLSLLKADHIAMPKEFLKKIDSIPLLCLENLLIQLKSNQDLNGLKDLLRWKKECPPLDALVFDKFSDRPDYLAELIKEGLIPAV